MQDPKFYQLLLTRAGLTSDMISKGERDFVFEEICAAMIEIHQGKQALYGDYLKTHGSDPTPFALMEHFSDLKRKYVRAETFVKRMLGGDKLPLEELLDTYSDLAVYGAIGIQLILFKMGMLDVVGASGSESSGGDGGSRCVRVDIAVGRDGKPRIRQPLEIPGEAADRVPKAAPRNGTSRGRSTRKR